MFNQKAAMFGLDARIALAIFGALSIISGAALFNSIKSSKVTAFATQLNELSKAYESFYIDTGIHIPNYTVHTLYTNRVASDYGISGWKGPYVEMKNHTGGYVMRINNKSIGDVSYRLGDIDGTWINASGCGAGKCYVWVSVTGENSESGVIEPWMMNAIDEHYDGAVDGTLGKLRTRVFSGVGNAIHLAIMPYN